MSGPVDPRRPVSSGSGAPPPRRSRTGSDDWASAASGAATPPAAAAPPASSRTVVGPAASPEAPPAGRRSGRADAAPGPAPRRARAPWWLRVVAWVVAVPLGLALVGIPARKLGYLDSQKLLDVLIGKSTDRYVPLVVIVPLWALVTALLVQLIVEGGGWALRRRRARRAPTPV